MANLPRNPLAVLRRHAVPAAVAATGVACSVAAFLYVQRAVEQQQSARFLRIASTSTAAVRDRLNAYTAMLRSTRGFFEALGREPDREEFHAFAESLEIGRFYPGVQGLGWATALRPGEVPAHQEAMRRATGDPTFRVWPEDATDLRSSIDLLEPLDWRNQRALGFDMYSEPIRRAAMARARDTGEVAISGKVELVQDAGIERSPGVLMYLPVYRTPPETPEQRRLLLAGWAYAPFRAPDVLQNTVGAAASHTIGLAVYDAATADAAALLFDDGVAGPGSDRQLEQRIEIAGRTWTLRYAATPDFIPLVDRLLPPLVLVSGLLLASLLFWITRSEVKARARAEQAARRTAFLAEAGKILAAGLEYRRTLADVVRLAAERVADVCLACVIEPEGPVWLAADRDASRSAAWRRALEEAGLDADAGAGAAAAIAARAPQVVELPPERLPFVARSPALLAAMRAARVRSAVTTPLLSRDQVLGAVTLLSTSGRLAPETARLSQDLARLAAAAIDTARLTLRAQEAVRLRDEFLSIASHELKTPLTSLALQSDSLHASARRADTEALVRKTEVIRRSVDRLARLVGSLLDLSRITAGKLELELEEVDLAEVARDVAARFEEEASRTGCELRLDAPAPVVGRWDRLRLDQVMTNLLSNAVKYGPGKPVDVRVRDDGPVALLSVRDHGIGISPADQQRIFERFERAVSKKNYGGFGLGLWIVREIVEALAGEVRVTSAPGEGSTFTIALPRPDPE